MIEDVETLLTTHGIKYIKRSGHCLCLCPNPLHNDKKIGSFSIDAKNGLCYCFACGFKGNIYTLNKLYGEKFTKNDVENLNFTKPIRPSKTEQVLYPKPMVYGKLYDPFYNSEVMDFMHGIGYSDDFIRQKEIKYCRYCEMISEDKANDINCKPTLMEDRIVIPIYKDGKLINYECRTFRDNYIKVKYVLGCSVQTLYNYENIDKNKTVIVVESIKNLANIWKINKNVVSMFHAIPSELQLDMLNECKDLLFYIDNDDAGFKTLKKFESNTEKDFRFTYDKRTYKKYDKEKETYIMKGFDCADCTMEENSRNLQKALKYSDWKNKNKFISEENLFWN